MSYVMYYLGIDPGKSGGLALLRPGATGIWTSLYKMPPTETDTWRLFAHWRETVENNPGTQIKAVIEKVHAMPQQGVSSTFKFGMGYGFLRGCLIASEIPFEEVPPQRWQKALHIPARGKTESKTEYKQRLRAVAQRYFPSQEITLATADALLMAYYLLRQENQK